MRKNVRTGLAISGAIIAAIITASASFCLFAWIAYELIYASMAAGHSGDPSIGDSVAWFIVFMWPIAVIVLGLPSIIAGGFALRTVYRKISAISQAPDNQQTAPPL
jgi:hypothetical protein